MNINSNFRVSIERDEYSVNNLENEIIFIYFKFTHDFRFILYLLNKIIIILLYFLINLFKLLSEIKIYDY